MKRVLTVLCLLLVATGCATIPPSAMQGEQAAQLKRHPQKYENAAREALQKWMEAHSAEDFMIEAVWIREPDVMLRASWVQSGDSKTGQGTTRRMANFVFKAESPMTVTVVDIDNALDGVATMRQDQQ